MGRLVSASIGVNMFLFIFGVIVLGLVGALPTPDKQDVRIVGGEDIDITGAPYQASILYRGRHSCGGTIIGSDIIVTAAHCVVGTSPNNYKIRVGSSSSETGGRIYAVGDLLSHPGFSYSKMDYDIAIMWLAQPITYGVGVAPIEMFESGEEIYDGELTVVTGWGHTTEGGGVPSTLQKVMIPKVNEKFCNDAYSPLYSISPRMLCAGAPQGGKDACQGDSGGPLVYNNKLAGVVSWGLGCARPDYPGVYAKVSSLRSWLDENILFIRLRHVMRS